MVSIYGLNEKVGNRSYYDSSGQSEYSFQKPYSEKTAELIDNEVSILIEKMYQRTLKLLSDNKENLVNLAELLLEKEVIFKEDLESIFGKRLFGEKEETPKPVSVITSLGEKPSLVPDNSINTGFSNVTNDGNIEETDSSGSSSLSDQPISEAPSKEPSSQPENQKKDNPPTEEL